MHTRTHTESTHLESLLVSPNCSRDTTLSFLVCSSPISNAVCHACSFHSPFTFAPPPLLSAIGFNTFLPPGYQIELPAETKTPEPPKPNQIDFDQAITYVTKIKVCCSSKSSSSSSLLVHHPFWLNASNCFNRLVSTTTLRSTDRSSKFCTIISENRRRSREYTSKWLNCSRVTQIFSKSSNNSCRTSSTLPLAPEHNLDSYVHCLFTSDYKDGQITDEL